MSRRPEPPRTTTHVPRFSAAERWVHRATAGLMGVCVLTAAFLYLPLLAESVGRRSLVVTVHQWAGVALPVPVLAGLVSRALRTDLGLLNRFGSHDRRWLLAALRRDKRPASRPAHKFNAGQKLYAAWAAGASLVMLGTGLMMWSIHLTPLTWRTGATFVHDWLALTLGVVLAGHIGMALGDPEARRGMRTGSVTPEWAEREHPLWQPGRRHADQHLRRANGRRARSSGRRTPVRPAGPLARTSGGGLRRAAGAARPRRLAAPAVAFAAGLRPQGDPGVPSGRSGYGAGPPPRPPEPAPSRALRRSALAGFPRPRPGRSRRPARGRTGSRRPWHRPGA